MESADYTEPRAKVKIQGEKWKITKQKKGEEREQEDKKTSNLNSETNEERRIRKINQRKPHDSPLSTLPNTEAPPPNLDPNVCLARKALKDNMARKTLPLEKSMENDKNVKKNANDNEIDKTEVSNI